MNKIVKTSTGQIAIGAMTVIFGLVSGCYAFTYAQGFVLGDRINSNTVQISDVRGDIKEINAKLDVLLRDRGYDPTKL